MPLCDYGCGQEAHYQMKNGKWCCMPRCCQCPEIKRKNSLGMKKAYKEGILDAKQIYQNKSQESKDRMIWGKGQTKETNESIRKQSETVKRKYQSGELVGTFTGRHHTQETKNKISKGTSKSYNYEADRKSGRGKKGSYKGFWCDSTYELAYIIYCIDHNISIIRNKEYFEYEYLGKKHRYYPDFIVDGELIEIKGFANGALPYKEQALKDSKRPYRILFPKDLQHVFQYIRETYNKEVNKNIEDLYE